MMNAIGQYLDATQTLRAARGALTDEAKKALATIQLTAQHTDGLMSQVELTQVTDPSLRHALEEARQTLGAISREAWKAYESLRISILGLAQLNEVEDRLQTKVEL